MWAPPKAQDSLELTRLYRGLEQALQQRPGGSVAITCAKSNDSVLRLAYDLAWVGSTLLGKRVLVLDTTGQGGADGRGPAMQSWEPPRPQPQSPAAPELESTAGTELQAEPPKQALIDMDRALRESNSVGLISLRVSPSRNVAIAPQLNEIWGQLKTTFDLILVAAPPVLADPTAAALGAVVDGNVLVVPSGTSRQGDVTRAIELLSAGATPFLGVVMTDRRNTFPRWLRWLFGNR